MYSPYQLLRLYIELREGGAKYISIHSYVKLIEKNGISLRNFFSKLTCNP